MLPLLADFIHARSCKAFCEKILTLPHRVLHYFVLLAKCLEEISAGRL